MCYLMGGLSCLRLLHSLLDSPSDDSVTRQTLPYHHCSMSHFCLRLFFRAHLLKLCGKLFFSPKMVAHGTKPRITFLGSTAAGLVRSERGSILSSTGQRLSVAMPSQPPQGDGVWWLLIPGEHVQSSAAMSEVGSRSAVTPDLMELF